VSRSLSVGSALFAAVCSLLLVLVIIPPAPTRAAGSATCANEQSPGFRAYLPNCRAYELVTPPYKEGYSPTSFGTGIMGVSADGEQVLMESIAGFAGLESPGLLGGNYRLARAANGWTSSPLEIPLSGFPVSELQSVSPDFSKSLWFSHGAGAGEQYLSLSSGGSVTRIGPSAPPGGFKLALNFTGASPDLLHDVFTARSPRGEEEHTLWPGDPTVGERTPSLYEYVGTGNAEPMLVGVSDEHRVQHLAESTLVSNCGTVLGSGGDTYNAISETGSTIFFTAEAGEACGALPAANQLYARIDQERTVAISEPSQPLAQGAGSAPEECDAACATASPKPGAFAGASTDGSKVFFLTEQPLLNGDRDTDTDLYEAEIEGVGAGGAGEGADAHMSRLIQVSRDPNAGQAAEVQGVARVSQDGSHVYFVARGVLTNEPDRSLSPGHQTPTVGEENLYVYERDARYPDGHTAFVATLRAADAEDWGARDLRPVQTTPDGRFLVFQSTADLTPDQEGRAEAGQLFEYDADTETLARVSVGQSGYNENGNSSVYPATIAHQEYVIASPVNRFLSLAISADGSYIFFISEDALVPQALSGINNVYEYHEGQVALISDGRDAVRLDSESATELIGTDESGRDVFFTTADSLVPQDTDTQVDLYDARIEGGFPSPTAPVPCSADACQNPPSAAPSLLAPGVSSSPEGAPASSSKPVIKAAPKKAPQKPKPKHKTKKHRAQRKQHSKRTKKSSVKQNRRTAGKRGTS
jgi:hypothetical protein